MDADEIVRAYRQKMEMKQTYLLSIQPIHLYKLKDFIDPKKLSIRGLIDNPMGMHLVEQRIEEKCLTSYLWSLLSGNSRAIPLLEKHPEKIDWNRLSGNENGIWLIQKYLDQKIPKRDPLKEIYSQDFIKSAEIDWYKLSKNPNAIPLLEKYPQNINKRSICLNPNAMPLIRQLFYPIVNPDRVDDLSSKLSVPPSAPQILPDWSLLSANPNPEAISFLEKHADLKWLLDWSFISMNPSAIHLLEENPEMISYPHLCMNPKALPLLEKNLDKVVWTILSREPFAVELLEKHLDKVDWNQLSVNPGAVSLLEKHLDKVDWGALFINPNALDLLKTRIDTGTLKLYEYCLLSRNPGIFELDYTVLRKRMDVLREELMKEAWHPKRVDRKLELAGEGCDIEDIM